MYPADDDPQWIQFYISQIQPFWQQQVESYTLTRPDGIKLRWYMHRPDHAKGLILISPGRIEAALKYQELVWNLSQANYAVAILDHRGQGFSDRLSDNPHHGHIDQFEDFVTDLAAVAKLATAQCPDLPQYLLAHSMGGTIGSLYLAQHDHQIQRAVLSAPMLGLVTGSTPSWWVQTMAVSGALLNRWLAPKTPWYFYSMGDYRYVPFDENELTHSESRYQMFRDAYKNEPALQLGGPTYNWVAQAYAAIRAAHRHAAEIEVPVLLLQAGADKVVCNDQQQVFVQQLAAAESQLMLIPEAKHELFMESDRYRQPALQQVLDWFQP